ncbi:MAG TPA: hypothetical protein DEB06_06385 [Phycisphaerales bacterium]|nr:hypothetical protein [Phycisphaerales bacterium]
MLTFAYKARDSRGAPVGGVTESSSQTEALRALAREGLTVTEIKLGARPIDADQVLLRAASSQVRREDVIAFASQVAVMLETGVPLAEALDAFVKQTKPGPIRSVMEVVSDRITGGVPFSQAIAEFPRAFPPLMINLMRASEASGTMGLMLGRIADYLTKERRTGRQIRGALAYPLVMISLALGITAFLVTWVLPKFAKIYEGRSAALPRPTRVVMGVSDFILGNWVLLSVLGVAAVGVCVALPMFDPTRRLLDALKLRTPVIGGVFRQFYLTRAARTLGTLLASGVDLLEAVRIVRGVTPNAQWEALWTAVERNMTTGKTMAEALQGSPLVPASVAQMIAAGERTGRMPDVLARIADATETDLDETVKNATQLIEPAMIVFMGVLIGGVAISLLLPIFNVSGIMGR